MTSLVDRPILVKVALEATNKNDTNTSTYGQVDIVMGVDSWVMGTIWEDSSLRGALAVVVQVFIEVVNSTQIAVVTGKDTYRIVRSENPIANQKVAVVDYVVI